MLVNGTLGVAATELRIGMPTAGSVTCPHT